MLTDSNQPPWRRPRNWWTPEPHPAHGHGVAKCYNKAFFVWIFAIDTCPLFVPTILLKLTQTHFSDRVDVQSAACELNVGSRAIQNVGGVESAEDMVQKYVATYARRQKLLHRANWERNAHERFNAVSKYCAMQFPACQCTHVSSWKRKIS